MSELYSDLEKIYAKVCEGLASLDCCDISDLEKEKLVDWMRDVLLELKIYLQAIVENKLYEDIRTS